MEKFVAYVDETGSFSYLDKAPNCFVGGWVCRRQEQLEKKLERFLQNRVNIFNKKPDVGKLRYPDDMHFMPLHTPPNQRSKADKNIKLQPKDAPIFFDNVFRNLRPQACFAFRSSGMPAIIPHEQAAYTEVLRNTLVQLIEDDFFPEEFSLQIIIASRRTNILYGYQGYDNPRKYEQYLVKSLKQELVDSSYPGFRPEIDIEFSSAKKHPGLMLADFFCGALKKNQYLNQSPEYIRQIYPFSEGFKVLPGIVKQLDFIRAQSPAAAFIKGAQIYSANQSERLFALLKDSYIQLSHDLDEKKLFFAALKNRLDAFLLENLGRYRNLNEAASLISLCRQCSTVNPENMDTDELRVKMVMDLHEIRIASHRGETDTSIIEKHFQFLARFKQKIFKNHLEYLQHRIDAVLIGIQVMAFNTLQFDKVEPYVNELCKEYDELFGKKLVAGEPIDENRAKLEGTIGQMYGFQYDLTGEKKYYDLAEQSLQKDVTACLAGGRTWEQGMGYLTSLYWHNGELERAVEQFLLETREEKSEHDLFKLGKHNLFGGMEKQFFFLHRLYLCALAREQGRQIGGVRQCYKRLLKVKNLNSYPDCLIGKWVAVLLMQGENYEDALKLLEQVLGQKDAGDFTIDFLRLPMKMLRHLCLCKLDRGSDFSLSGEMEYLENLQPGTLEILEKLGIDRFETDNSDSWRPYDIALLPPFYYA